jgi:hypothetical protein
MEGCVTGGSLGIRNWNFYLTTGRLTASSMDRLVIELLSLSVTEK